MIFFVIFTCSISEWKKSSEEDAVNVKVNVSKKIFRLINTRTSIKFLQILQGLLNAETFFSERRKCPQWKWHCVIILLMYYEILAGCEMDATFWQF